MAYSQVSDLLTGDIGISDTVDTEKVVNDAAEEIDSKIGFVYSLPLPFDALPIHQQLLLKQINNKLASGRLILQMAIGGEDTALHAYGLRLVTEATNELMLIANGQVDLDAPLTNDAEVVTDDSKVPLGRNHDAESAVDMFEAVVHRGESAYWNPGNVVVRGYPGESYRGG